MENTSGTTSDLDKEINNLMDMAFAEMDDDFNTPKALARLYELVSKINGIKDGHLSMNDITANTLERLKKTFTSFINDIFGFTEVAESNGNSMDGVMELLIDIRQEARKNKDWGTSDKIRDGLNKVNIVLKDGKDGTSWSQN